MSGADAGPMGDMDPPAWFNRVFRFELPPWLMANVIERLRGTPARLEERVAGVSGAVARKRDRDRWSIQENAGHLLDLESLWLGRIEDFEAGRDRLRAADLLNRATHEANHNSRPLEDLLEGFRSARALLVERFEEMDGATQRRTALHPRLAQPMRPIDHAFFVAEHDDHHLARITELLGLFRTGL